MLWEGEPLEVAGARAGRDLRGRAGRRRPGGAAALAERTGAVAVDMESGALAATGRLAGVVRAVSDRRRGRSARSRDAAKPDGGDRLEGRCALAFVVEPVRSVRALRRRRRGLGPRCSAPRRRSREQARPRRGAAQLLRRRRPRDRHRREAARAARAAGLRAAPDRPQRPRRPRPRGSRRRLRRDRGRGAGGRAGRALGARRRAAGVPRTAPSGA